MNRFSVNRNVIRKALKELQIKYLIEHYPNRGAIVADPSQKEVLDIYSMRILLEKFASILIVKNIAEQQLKEIEQAAIEFKKASDLNDFTKMISSNIEFHNKIFHASGNRILSETIDQLRRRTHLVKHYRWRAVVERKRSAQEHDQIVKALKDRDVDKLISLNENHVKTGLSTYLKLSMPNHNPELVMEEIPTLVDVAVKPVQERRDR
jgi:DNA-binding GntR family transcriptional regulator